MCGILYRRGRSLPIRSQAGFIQGVARFQGRNIVDGRQIVVVFYIMHEILRGFYLKKSSWFKYVL